jgi:hypothetical protein
MIKLLIWIAGLFIFIFKSQYSQLLYNLAVVWLAVLINWNFSNINPPIMRIKAFFMFIMAVFGGVGEFDSVSTRND